MSVLIVNQMSEPEAPKAKPEPAPEPTPAPAKLDDRSEALKIGAAWKKYLQEHPLPIAAGLIAVGFGLGFSARGYVPAHEASSGVERCRTHEFTVPSSRWDTNEGIAYECEKEAYVATVSTKLDTDGTKLRVLRLIHEPPRKGMLAGSCDFDCSPNGINQYIATDACEWLLRARVDCSDPSVFRFQMTPDP